MVVESSDTDFDLTRFLRGVLYYVGKSSQTTLLASVVVWYLMIPPTSRQKIHDDLPLSQWEKLQTFETASQCQAALADLYNPGIDERMKAKTDPEGYKLFKHFMEDMRCVQSTELRQNRVSSKLNTPAVR